MFIIDFRNKLVSDYRFSVIGNSNVDKVDLVSHFTQYASGYSIYLKVRSEDERYVDKIAIASENVSVDEDVLVCRWTMGLVSTQCKKLYLQLQFEQGEEIIAQSRIVSVVLGDTINVDELIPVIYPQILKELQNQIDTLKAESVAIASMVYANDTLTLVLKNKASETLSVLEVSIPLSDKYTKEEVNTIVGGLVAKLTSGNKVYATNNNGEQIGIDVDYGSTFQGKIVRRSGNDEQIYVPLTPTQNGHAVSKYYLDQLIDEIEQRSDVVDVVGTYAELEAYDTSHLAPNSLIKVINDETHNNEITYYRWVITGGVGAWVYVASEGAYYTKAQIDLMLANYYTKAQADENIPNKQATFTIVLGALTNLNGRVLSSYEAVRETSPYTRWHITKGGNELTEEQAKDYMEYMSGSRFLPTYNYEKPKNSVWIMIDLLVSFVKPQYENGEMYLYEIPNPFAYQVQVENLNNDLEEVSNAYFNLYEASVDTEIKWSKMLSFSKSADTTFTFETAKTSCLNEYKALLTNSGASTITITLPSGVSIETNDDNIVVSSNTFTLPSDTTIELNCVNNWCVVYNHSAN